MFNIKNRYLYVALLAGYSFINIKFTEGDALITLPVDNWILLLIICWLVVLVWEGNRLIGYWMESFSGIKTANRLIRQFLTSIILVVAISLLSALLIELFLSIDTGWLEIKLLLGFNFRINLFLHCINAIIVYNRELSTSRTEAEKLRVQTAEARFQALSNQIKPHFLFNSFNVLMVLIETKPKVAVEFLEQMSSVYRYVLRTQDSKLVKLNEEVEFLNSYLFLIKMRFPDTLKIDFRPDLDHQDHFLPPSTLQLLLENAIKHNEVSKQHPLTIELLRDGDWLTIRNSRNPKNQTEPSSKVGLQNITNRYELLGSAVPEVIEDDETFTVKIPLLTSP